MTKKIILTFALMIFCTAETQFAQTWARVYSGYGSFNSIEPTADGGFIATGDVYLLKCYPYAIPDSIWVIKLDRLGNIEWQKVYGCGEGRDIQQTADGGFVLLALYLDVGGPKGSWIYKLDAMGNVEWVKTYIHEIPSQGGAAPYSIRQTKDGGFVAAGHVLTSQGYDIWVLKVDSSGNIEWWKFYGDNWKGSSLGPIIRLTKDGGFIVGADAYIPVCTAAVLLKLGASGDVEWDKAYCSEAIHNRAWSVQQTADNGFIVAGESYFTETQFDMWIFKTDETGNIEWQKFYGGPGSKGEVAFSIQQTEDGGFIVGGRTESFGAGERDIWVLKLDPLGNIQWEKTYGGRKTEECWSIRQTPDGGFVVIGYTGSFASGLSGDNPYFSAWVLKLDPNGNINPSCTFIGDSTATVTNSSATIRTAMAMYYSDSVSVDVAGVVVDGPATAVELCAGGVCPAPTGCVPPGGLIYPTDFVKPCDGCVDELIEFSYSFGSFCGDDWYNSDADFNGNDVVDGEDLSIFVNDFGAGCF